MYVNAAPRTLCPLRREASARLLVASIVVLNRISGEKERVWAKENASGGLGDALARGLETGKMLLHFEVY